MKKLIIIAITIATVAGLVYAQTVRWRIQEIDGTVLATVNSSGDLILAGDVTAVSSTLSGTSTFNEEVVVNLDAQDEEFEITTSSGSESARGVLRIINSDTTVTDQHYLLELWQYDLDASAAADFIVATTSGTHATKVDKFVLANDGSINFEGTLTAGSGDNQLTNAAGLIDGEKIQDDTIDEDSIDFGSGTDQVGFEDFTYAFVMKTDSYTITASEMNKVLVMTKATPATFTLPISTSVASGQYLYIKNKVTDGQELTIARNGSAADTIDGASSDLTTLSINDVYLLINDSANNDWIILSVTVR